MINPGVFKGGDVAWVLDAYYYRLGLIGTRTDEIKI